MRSVIVLILSWTVISTHADTFLCQGSGRFAPIRNKTVKLEWKKENQKVLLENEALKCQVYVDKANSDGTHYLGIEVLELNKNGVVSFRGAKGSLKDMVQFSDSATSQISCLPIAE